MSSATFAWLQNILFKVGEKVLKNAKPCKWIRITIKWHIWGKGQGRKIIAERHFLKHYGKQDEMYSRGLQMSGFMSVTLDQWPELMRCYMLPGTRAGKLLFWCTLESGEFQKSCIWWKTEQASVAQWPLTSWIYWDTIPCWEKVSTLMRAFLPTLPIFWPAEATQGRKSSCQCLSVRKCNGF